MGAKLSNPSSSSSSSESKKISSSETDEDNSVTETFPFVDGMGGIDFSIISDLSVDILSFVPGKDLIKNCRLVCKDWKNMIDGHCIWKLKCKREKKYIPSIYFENLPAHYYEKIYFHNPYGRNLIENPHGEDGLKKWTLTRNGGDGFVVENPPQGADPVPQEVGSQSCFATACLPCVKHQIINLLAIGIAEEVLQMENAKIKIGEWFAARFDCASEYRLNVILLDEKYDPNDEEITVELHMTDHFEFQYREDQWVGKEWHTITHTFENVGKARYVFFQHFGKDCQYWAGNYGSKMTGAFVKVLV